MNSRLQAERLTVLPLRLETITIDVSNIGVVSQANSNHGGGGACVVNCTAANTQVNVGVVNQNTNVVAIDLDAYRNQFANPAGDTSVNVENVAVVAQGNTNHGGGGPCVINCATTNTQANVGAVNQSTTVTAINVDAYSNHNAAPAGDTSVNVENVAVVAQGNSNNSGGSGPCVIGCATTNTQANVGVVNQNTQVVAIDIDTFNNNYVDPAGNTSVNVGNVAGVEQGNANNSGGGSCVADCATSNTQTNVGVVNQTTKVFAIELDGWIRQWQWSWQR